MQDRRNLQAAFSLVGEYRHGYPSWPGLSAGAQVRAEAQRGTYRALSRRRGCVWMWVCGWPWRAWRAREQIKTQRLGIVGFSAPGGLTDTPVAALATTHAPGVELCSLTWGCSLCFGSPWKGPGQGIYVCPCVSVCVCLFAWCLARASVCCRVGLVLGLSCRGRSHGGWGGRLLLPCVCQLLTVGSCLVCCLLEVSSSRRVIRGRQIRRASFLPAAVTFYWAARCSWR